MKKPARSRKAAAPTPLRVLVVDDSTLMRRIIVDIVARSPQLAVVGEARDGVEALEMAAALAPDVILLDIEMPRMNGLDFLRAARLRSAARIIVVSSIARPGTAACLEALALGASDILPKPSGALSLDLAERHSQALLDSIHACRLGTDPS